MSVNTACASGFCSFWLTLSPYQTLPLSLSLYRDPTSPFLDEPYSFLFLNYPIVFSLLIFNYLSTALDTPVLHPGISAIDEVSSPSIFYALIPFFFYD